MSIGNDEQIALSTNFQRRRCRRVSVVTFAIGAHLPAAPPGGRSRTAPRRRRRCRARRRSSPGARPRAGGRSPWRRGPARHRPSCGPTASFSFQNKDLPADAMTAPGCCPARPRRAAAASRVIRRSTARIRARCLPGPRRAAGRSRPRAPRHRRRRRCRRAGSGRLRRRRRRSRRSPHGRAAGRLGRGVEIERELGQLLLDHRAVRRRRRRSAGRRRAEPQAERRGQVEHQPVGSPPSGG